MSRFLKALKLSRKTEKKAEKEEDTSVKEKEERNTDEELLATTDEEAGEEAAGTSAASSGDAPEQEVRRDGEAHEESVKREKEVGIRFTPQDGLNAEHPNAFLSPWFQVDVVMEGNFWPTVEHWIQSKRGSGSEWRESVRTAESPQAAMALGEAAAAGDNANDAFEEEIAGALKEMLKALFAQKAPLGEKLIATSGLLQYDTSDKFWGTGGADVEESEEGKNTYGKVLAEAREEMRMKRLKSAMASGTPLSM